MTPRPSTLTSATNLSGAFSRISTVPLTFIPAYAPSIRPFDTRVESRAPSARLSPVASA